MRSGDRAGWEGRSEGSREGNLSWAFQLGPHRAFQTWENPQWALAICMMGKWHLLVEAESRDPSSCGPPLLVRMQRRI